MGQTEKKFQNLFMYHFEAVDRIGSIPLVENGIKRVENVYERIKTNNRIFNWYFDTAESTLVAALESVQPVMRLVEGPLKRIDSVMCQSLDILEERAPLVYLPPEMMYWNTREYMSDRLVKPVIKRADSVKQLNIQIGNRVLESSLTTYAAERLDGAITVADKYVDKYIAVDKDADQTDGGNDKSEEPTKETDEKSAIRAIHHGQRFSRKLKRTLTQRTLLEARALKKQSKEAIHILIYAAELIVTDPKQALEKTRELWKYLSHDEPENQARPQTLEQLILLLTRESARRVVHLVNYTSNAASNLPQSMVHSATEIVHRFICITNRLTNLITFETAKGQTSEGLVGGSITGFTQIYSISQNYVSNSLERLAIFLSGRIEAEKISNSTTNTPRRRIPPRTNNHPMQNSINGVTTTF